VPTDGSTHCGRCPHGGATRNGIAILIIRGAVRRGAEAIADLVTELGFHTSAEDIAARPPILCERPRNLIRVECWEHRKLRGTWRNY
jgi:hypothetical protein